ncbi:Site-specific recombinase, phage integrase family [Candidatus Sulfobium mesophilum]|uniref:Site-specific recombinase, phage integrase family n=1 Tax=Candidatus Sulfobium mesophilum TaxID=2016548 RepID=A0A2U3QGF9_9BACT|nr:Site-specific recombinase, phage integrase family [Candidatus Sulfobium mesophilum]
MLAKKGEGMMITDTKTTENYRQRTRYQGVYERASETRNFKGKPDICYDITYRAGGKFRWEKVGWLSEGYSAKLAADVRAERVRSIRHKEELPRDKKKALLLKDLASKYLEWAKENKSDHGEHDKGRYENHLEARIGDKRLDEITTLDLERVKSELLKSDLSPATVKHCLVLVRQIFNKAVTWGLYKGMNPIKGVKLPQLQNQRERFLSYQEADILLAELEKRSAIVHDMALLSLHTGMRAGEIFGLRCHDIDLRHGLITILDPKNKQARKAHMTKAVRELFSKRVIDLGPDDYLFTQHRGIPFNEMSKIFGTVADELFNKGVKDRRQRVTFHSLRHTFGSWLALQGESLVTIRELLGHKSFAMTQRYAHLIPDEKSRASAALETAFNENRSERYAKEM